MSKSKGNTIALFEEREAFWNKLRVAFTDPQRLRRSDPGRPEVCNIYTMHKALSTPEQVDLTYKECKAAQRGCIDCKKILMEGFDRELVPLRAKRAELDRDPARTLEALGDGAAKARRIAEATMGEVREKMGLGRAGAAPAITRTGAA
jgi:tryptophanyl-tRNA synthetase